MFIVLFIYNLYNYKYDYTCDISNDLKNAIECHKVPGSLIAQGVRVGVGLSGHPTKAKHSPNENYERIKNKY